MLKLVVLLGFLAAFCAAENKGIAIITTGVSGVSGSLTFTELSGGGVHIVGTIKGLTRGKHGFHIHSKGDLTDGCGSTGSHFNPYNKTHGAPDAEHRHVGDLGNIEAGANGIATVDITDKIICLTGETGILGRAVVVHSGEDDLGLQDTDESHTTGSAGSRVGCGIIGIL
ncbi:superoxide dismutase [Cu-Zn]-like [Onthophagus taurus]|uniref:superoxide dismutase [Cu-Zn]-like n=1 Tax=Onthophagus taurus TaxID=166361 RepID=UPI0039BE90D8